MRTCYLKIGEGFDNGVGTAFHAPARVYSLCRRHRLEGPERRQAGTEGANEAQTPS